MIVAILLPVMLGLFFAFFMSYNQETGFNNNIFLICLGMIIAVIAFTGAIPKWSLAFTALLYTLVIFGGRMGIGGGSDE
ncbi:MAG: hypothetical protein R6V50_02245 [Thermoplasmatota archaeon]